MSTINDIQSLLTKIAKDLDSYQDDLNSNYVLKAFIATSKDNTVEEIMRHNEILDHEQNQDNQD